MLSYPLMFWSQQQQMTVLNIYFSEKIRLDILCELSGNSQLHHNLFITLLLGPKHKPF